ncbi:MAG: adenylate/guanylate cyclase domain-containing protein, partial [Thiolinea sp.]
AVLNNANDLLEKVVPYEIRILAFKAQNRLLDAINTGLDVLGQLGEDFPRKATMGHVMLDLLDTKRQLRGKDIAILSALPDMSDPQKIAAMRIIADIASSSYWATPALFPLLIFRMCKLSLSHGNTALSAFGFSAYGVIMCGVLGTMRSGYEYGKLGLILLNKYDARAWLAQIYTPIYSLINVWNEHVENTFGPLQDSYHIGLETGAIEFACINSNLYCINAYLSGRTLEKIEAEARAYSESFARFKQETNVNYNEVYRQGMLNFMGKSNNPLILTGSAYNEDKMMAQNSERNDQTGKFFIHFNKLILCYFFHDFKQAQEHARESRKLLEAVLAKFEIPNHHFYEALTLLALYPSAKHSAKLKIMARVRSTLLKLKKWAKYAPENYQHKYFLVRAEHLRVSKRYGQARIAYDQAIQLASAHRYIHEEALAYEVTGRFYQQQKAETQAEFHFKAAYNSYREWGAKAKLKHLNQLYPQIISGTLGQSSLSTAGTLTVDSITSDTGNLDLITLHKASTAISGEIVLRNLLKVLMEIVIENAGARRGYLLLETDGELFIETEYDLDQQKTAVMEHEAFADCEQIARSVIQYIHRTRQNIVITDATNDSRFAKDAYILAQQPRSILSLPVINQGKFIGILYLENNLNTGVFTQNLSDMLSILAGQIAVSLDNAILYENLEQKVEERTEQLNQEKQKSDQLLRNILPTETAEELKQHGKALPRRYDNVTIMFTDFTDFTRFTAKLSADELVAEIDTCFAAFDQIMQRHGVEKIKTIGDAYMCVGGLPVANSTHARDVVNAALDIRAWMAEHKQQRAEQGLASFDIRIGLNSGPIVAGVVGTHKFAYDIWGRAVNTAARLEAGSEAGMINISSQTYALIKDQFECQYRGKLPAKNMEDIAMYFVKGHRTESKT